MNMNNIFIRFLKIFKTISIALATIISFFFFLPTVDYTQLLRMCDTLASLMELNCSSRDILQLQSLH